MMVNKKLFISLVIAILLSLFFFIAEYRHKIEQATITRQQLSLLEILDIFTDTDERLAQLLTSGNRQAWLHLAKHHGDTSADTAYQLGKYFQADKQTKLAKLWYQVAIRQQHVAARLTLANIYFKQQQYADIKPLLLPIISNSTALAQLYVLALHQGDLAFIQEYKSNLAQADNIELYRELKRFSVFNSTLVQSQSEQKDTRNIRQNNACDLDVQLFATSLKGLRHGRQLMSAFEHHSLAKYICLRTPKYITADAINCQHLATEQITCNASVWIKRKDISARYLGVIVERGGANVDSGIMYIDQQDNVEVLVHELSHLIGFVDEYPLPSQHQKCQQFQQMPFAHNLVVLSDYYQGSREALRASILLQVPWRSLIKDSTPILSKHQQGWALATPQAYQDEIGLFTSATCNAQDKIQAFKPLAQRTTLEYFELDFPKVYADIMALAPKHYLMPSYHFNVSRDLAEQGEYNKAREILQVTLFE